MPRGAPSKFNEKLRETMIRLYESGKTDQEIAEIVGVCVRTLQNWRGKDSDFLLAIREAKQLADDLVEASLFQRACGYTHPEEKVFQYEGQIITHETRKHYPPDTQAISFWLRNRQPSKWRDDQEKVVINNNVGQKSDEELDARINELLEKQKTP